MAMCKFCTLCITTCHADHDVKYIRNGRHFCDCGAEEEKTALLLFPYALISLNFNFPQLQFPSTLISFALISLDYEFPIQRQLDLPNKQEIRQMNMSKHVTLIKVTFCQVTIRFKSSGKLDMLHMDSFPQTKLHRQLLLYSPPLIR